MTGRLWLVHLHPILVEAPDLFAARTQALRMVEGGHPRIDRVEEQKMGERGAGEGAKNPSCFGRYPLEAGGNQECDYCGRDRDGSCERETWSRG